MAEDWQKIGNDIRKIYDYGKSWLQYIHLLQG
jgi:hypothetical protein